MSKKNVRWVMSEVTFPIYLISDKTSDAEERSIIAKDCLFKADAIFFLIKTVGQYLQDSQENIEIFTTDLGESLLHISALGQGLNREAINQIDKLLDLTEKKSEASNNE